MCTGDGTCADHCPDVIVLLEHGISYVSHPTGSPGKAPGVERASSRTGATCCSDHRGCARLCGRTHLP
ncbi:MAG: ferredoxin [Acidimicrobiales bacterium]